MQRWEDWGGLFLQAKPSQRRELNVAGEEGSQARNQAKRTCIEDTLCPLALRSPPIAATTRIPHTPLSLKRRAPFAHAILLPMGSDIHTTSTQLGVEGASPVDAHLSSAHQILFAAMVREGRNTVCSWLHA